MAKYSTLKQERDDAVERAVIAERNSQLETLERERKAHADQVAALSKALEAVAYVATRLESRAGVCSRTVARELASDERDLHRAALYKDEAILCGAHAEDIREALKTYETLVVGDQVSVSSATTG